MFFHTVDRAVVVLVVLPCHLITRLGWADIGDFVIADRFGVVVFAAPQFVPCIVGRSVFVGVLRHPHDARFGRRVELVAFDVEVVSARVGTGSAKAATMRPPQPPSETQLFEAMRFAA